MQKNPPPTSLPLNSKVDDLYRTSTGPRPFCFDARVAEVFDDMISRSVPLYREVVHLACDLACRFYEPGTKVYDIGCSTGTVLAMIAKRLAERKASACLVGIDSSAPMLVRAREKMAKAAYDHRVELLCQDVAEVEYDTCSVIVLNYTLQFLPIERRKDLLINLRHALVPHGVLILSEKIIAEDASVQQLIQETYSSYKILQGYSRTEIERKKEALDDVLIPLTLNRQCNMLREAGFSRIETIAKWLNFTTIIASP